MRGKTICLALCAAAAVNAFCGGYAYAEAAAEYAGGNGTEATPYLIENVSQLEHLRDTVNSGDDLEGKCFELADDIDLGGSTWTPIGAVDNSFSGHFNGAGYTVSGLCVSAEEDAGLFGSISGASISNLTVSGTVEGKNHVGGIVGYSENSTITHCANFCTVEGESHVGGIAGGSHNDSLIENCYNTGDVTGTNQYIGGIAGYTSGKVKYCYDYVQVTGINDTGGVVGHKASGVEVDYSYYLENKAPKAIGSTDDPGANVKSLTAEQFADEANKEDNFIGWDFTDIWAMSVALKRPVFRSQAVVEKHFAGVFDAHEDVPPAAAFYADITAVKYAVTGIEWRIALDGINTTIKEELQGVKIADGTTVRYGFVVSVGNSEADAKNFTAAMLDVITLSRRGAAD